MFHWLDDLIDIIETVFDFRYYWRIYAGVAAGFVLIFLLSTFITREQISVAVIIACLVVPGILGGVWHKQANKN